MPSAKPDLDFLKWAVKIQGDVTAFRRKSAAIDLALSRGFDINH